MTQAPMNTPPAVGFMRPHRGVMILVFGILSLVMGCVVFGIVAWVMGNGDLKEMDAGRMDPEGRGLTQAGKICGIISVVLAALGIIFTVLWIILFIVIGIGAAAASGP